MSDLAFLGSRLPEAWSEGRLADATSKIGSGATPRGGAAVYVETGTSFIRSQNVYDHEFRSDGLARISHEAAEQLKGVTVEPGDVLLNITGDSILRTCLAPLCALPARVSQHVAIIRPNERVVPEFLQKWLSLPAMKSFMLGHSSGGTRKAITKGHLLSFPIPLPPIEEQRGIAATLGALDDKIESNRRARQLLRALGQALVARDRGARSLPLRELTTSISRGVTPKYADGDPNAPVVINQKCVRDGWVTLAAARRMVGRQVAIEKRIVFGDILVNSTGTGTLGRVGRWHAGEAFADSHVSIVRADTNRIGPTLLAYLIFPRQLDIEDMATGSTGQTELSPARLGDLLINVPTAEAAERLEPTLVNLESRAAALESETEALARVRDTLLPELLSGRIRVPEAREAVVEAAGSV